MNFQNIFLISLILLTIFINIGNCNNNNEILKLKSRSFENEKKIADYYNEYLKFKQQQQATTKTATNLKSLSTLNQSFTVSKNCSNAMSSIFDFSNPNPDSMMLMLYSGVGMNEVGNYDSCIELPSNVSQYCLYNGNLESLSFYIGVCYPSAEVCSPDDILGLMTQFTILEILQLEMNLTVSNLVCYNGSYPSAKINSNSGTWVMTAISGFILLNILIGSLIDYFLIYKLNLYKKSSYSNHQQNPYSLLLNPKSYFEPTSTNLQDIDDDDDGDGVSNQRIKYIGPPFYSFIYDKLIEIDNENNKIIKYFTCWSIIKNFNSLVHNSSSKAYFNSFDGIRTLGTCWVVLGHSLLFAIGGFGFDNMMSLTTIMASFSFQVIYAGEFAVDTFFMISGFLVAYSLIGALDKIDSSGGGKNKTTILDSIKFWFIYVIHRFVRLSPLYFFLIFFGMWVMPLMGSGPIYYQFDSSVNSGCSSHWWTNVLYINNFYQVQCYPVSWYLANDMQFFLFSPFLIVLFRKSKSLGFLSVLTLIIASIIGTTVASYKHNIAPFFDLLGEGEEMTNANFANIHYITGTYDMPWYRIGAYLVGTIIAFIYKTPNISKKVRFAYHYRLFRYFIYAVSLFITFFISYIPYTFYKGNSIESATNWSITQQAIYDGFSHPFFVIGLSLFILALFYGYGGIVRWFLELRIFKFFSKLTYSTYLVHPLVIYYRLYSMTNFLHYSTIEFSVFFISNLVFSFGAAFIIHLLIEKPFINLERLIFNSK